MGRLYRVTDDDPKLVEARRESANSLKQVPTLKTEQIVELLGILTCACTSRRRSGNWLPWAPRLPSR